MVDSRSSAPRWSASISSSASAAVSFSSWASSSWRSSRPSSSSRSASSPGRSRRSAWFGACRRIGPGGATPPSVWRPVPNGWIAAQSMTRSGVGARPPPRRPEPAQQRLEADVDADQPVLVADAREIEVGGADDPDPVDVDELVVDDVAVEDHLAGPALEVAQVEAGGLQRHPLRADLVHVVDRHERAAAPDPHHEPGDRRVRLAPPAHHDVGQAADLGAVAVAHGPAHQAGDRHERVGDGAVGQQALGSVLTPAAERGRSGQRWTTSHDDTSRGGRGRAQAGPAVDSGGRQLRRCW